jgi:hypothetical protein
MFTSTEVLSEIVPNCSVYKYESVFLNWPQFGNLIPRGEHENSGIGLNLR